MAKFTPGPAVAAVSGSVGGTVFSRNRYGAYMRFRAIPVKSTTADALAAKSRMATYSAAWSALTAAQRLAWNAYAQTHPQPDALGFPQILTGHVLYVGLNTRLAHASQSAIDIPPLQNNPVGLVTLSATWDLGLGDFSLHFVRNREKEEVDFLIANQEKPFLLIEVKQSETSPSKSLIKFQKMLNVPAVQLVDKTGICKILSNGDQKLMVISADHWLSLLP